MSNRNHIKTAVLLASYNGSSWLSAQIKSILAQDSVVVDLFISDDFSDNDTIKVLSNFKNLKNISIKKHDKNFGSGAMNFIYMLKSFNLNNYDFIALSDQDDIWKNDKLLNAISKLKQGYDGYSSNVSAFWEDGGKKLILKNQTQKKFDHLFESAGPGCTFVINKKLFLTFQEFLKKGYFNQLNNYHDWLIYAFARANNFKWYIDSYDGVLYRQHSSNFFGANVGFKAFASRANQVLLGEGIDFAFRLIKVLKIQDSFIQSLFPVSRFNLLRLALKARCCRRRFRDQIYFFFACFLLAIIFPKKLRAI